MKDGTHLRLPQSANVHAAISAATNRGILYSSSSSFSNPRVVTMAAPGHGVPQIVLNGKELDLTAPVPPRPGLTSEQLFPYVAEAQDVTREATEHFTKAIDALHRRACDVTNEYRLRVQDEIRRLRNDNDNLRGNLHLMVAEGEQLTEEKEELKKDLQKEL